MTPLRPWRIARAAVLSGLSLMAVLAHAEYPDKPIRMVVGFGPGTGSDIQTRAFADALARELKVSVVVENKPGASGALAAAAVAAAAPDGYTLIFGTTLFVTLPLMNPAVKYNAVRDFTAIGTLGKGPFIVYTANKPTSPATLRELLTLMKNTSVSFGSIGSGTFSHLATVRMMQQAGVNAVHIPYKSSPQEMQDVVAGNLLFATDSSTAGLPLVRNGLLRALAVTTKNRMASLPDVPTVGEVLGNDYEHTVWTGVLAPAGVPPDVVHKLSVATAAAVASPELQARYAQMEIQPFSLDAAAFASHIRGEMPFWKDFLQRADIKLEP